MDRFPKTAREVFSARRARLASRLDGRTAIFAAGELVPRNYPANAWPYRASSHFLYFAGRAEPGMVLAVGEGHATLFAEPPDADDALWHGPRPALTEVATAYGIPEVRPRSELSAWAKTQKNLGVIPPVDALSAAWLSEALERDVRAGSASRLDDPHAAKVADAVIFARLIHDDAALAQLAAAAQHSAEAHRAGMLAGRSATTELEIAYAITSRLREAGMADAYGPIVTVRGEILHSRDHDGAVKVGDLLLADVGGESPEGWASDITRTWPIGGKFSATQRAIYEIVLSANVAAIDRVRAGTSYRAIHERAKEVILAGLIELGILRGAPEGLMERGAVNLFFPHGVGHLLGLDVHDMEDLGDRAGYAKGRVRSERFGDRYLRLDRDLEPGMAVTIEPGFYVVPEILGRDELTRPLGSDLRRDVLQKFHDVRGIRIEDDVVCTAGAPRVLSADCPKSVADIEALMNAR